MSLSMDKIEGACVLADELDEKFESSLNLSSTITQSDLFPFLAKIVFKKK